MPSPAGKLHEQEGGRALGHDLLVVGEVPGTFVGRDVLARPAFPASRTKMTNKQSDQNWA